jgi:hypothetical protein
MALIKEIVSALPLLMQDMLKEKRFSLVILKTRIIKLLKAIKINQRKLLTEYQLIEMPI